MNIVFALIFLIVALLYSLIGFGGGSSYIAFLFLFNIPFEHIPVIALICNLIVVSGSSFNYLKNKDFSFLKVLPFVVTSIPAAFVAGSINIPKDTFLLVLGITLLLAAIRMIIKSREFSSNSSLTNSPHYLFAMFTGLVLGFLSGLVGVGGGIFLSPIMYNLRWGKAKEIAGICCFFILFNSTAGLIGQFQKGLSFSIVESYWTLFLAVFIGGLIGSYFGTTKLKPRYIQILTSVLILFVSLRILFFT
jgi:hypothetical protein